MSIATEKKDSRLTFRVRSELKARIEEAAQASDTSLTEFCISAIRRAADEKLRLAQSIHLRGRDAEAFFEALMEPPSPNDALIRAAREHRGRVVSD